MNVGVFPIDKTVQSINTCISMERQSVYAIIATSQIRQCRFGLIDPSGTGVDVVQQIELAPGYLDRYMK